MVYLFFIYLLCSGIVFTANAMENKSINPNAAIKQSFTDDWYEKLNKLKELGAIRYTLYEDLLAGSANAGIILGDKAHFNMSAVGRSIFPWRRKVFPPQLAIYHAIDYQQTSFLKLLLQHNISLNILNDKEQTPLAFAYTKLDQSLQRKNKRKTRYYTKIVSLLQQHILKQSQEQTTLIDL